VKTAENRQEMTEPLRERASLILFAVVVAGVGVIVENQYYLQIFTFIGINTLLALGLNMLMGYAGQVSLGHAAFFGLGAYATGIFTVHLGLSPWLGLPFSLGLAAVVAFFVGLPTLKLTGYYLGMGTLGFGMIAYVVFREWAGLTGGPSGLVGIPPLAIGKISLATGRNALYVVWGAVIVSFFVCGRLVKSRLGRALRAIHYSEPTAAAMGIDTGRAKLQVFVFSAILAALAGFLYAHIVTFVSPGSFNFLVSVRLVAMVVVGGMANTWGALLGAILLSLLPEFLHVFADYEMLIYGFILMAVMIFLPEGLAGGLVYLYERSRNR
jgi:branched-chain amino acid transport system permease protein